MQLTCPDLSPRQAPGHSTAATAREGERFRIPLADKPGTVSTPFRPLDPDIVSEAIPAFFIGRNKEGFWVARDVNGRIGGIFLLESSALSFARKHSGAAGCATIRLSERFELDLENEGNPLVVQLASLIGLARHPWKRLTALVGKMTGATKRRTQVF
jgi:hypothetical protein